MPPTIETDLKDILNRLDQRLDRIEQNVGELKIGVAKLEEKVDGQGKNLETKIDGLSKRLKNQEFINRGVLIAL